MDALDPQACGGAGCWTNHLRVTDIDGDGDLDLLIANYPDFFDGDDDPEPLVVYANDGNGGFTNVSTSAVGDFVGNLRQVAVGDVDGDGAVDLFAAQGNGDPYVLFINDGTGVFSEEAAMRLPAGDHPRGAAARMGDVDGDGDLDIFSADGYAVAGPPFGRLYLNDGLGMFEEAEGAIPDSISGIDIDDVEFVDVDRDFDLDLVVNAHANGTGALWLNDGAGVFTEGGSIDPPGNSGYHYNAAPCDVDGDGDLDLWIDNIGGDYREQLLINDGAGNFTDETAARVTGNASADDNGVVCADIDDDGDLDAVVISLSGPERMLENDGSGNFTYVAGVFPLPGDCSLWGEFGDLNGDGRIDLVTGQGECGDTSNQVYLASEGVPADSTAPALLAVEDPSPVAPGAEALVRFAVADRTVTDEGPRLVRAWAVVEPEGAATELDAGAMGGDLFRVVLPAVDRGPVTFRVCAEDRNANVGCSEDQTYEIGEDPGETGDTGDTGADSTGGTGPNTGGVDSTGPGGASMTGVTAGGSGGADVGATEGETDTESGGAADDGGGGGCGCRQQPAERSWGWLSLGLLVLMRRRGRGSRSPRRSPA